VITGVVAIAGAAMTVVRLASRSDWPAWAIRTLKAARRTTWSDALALWREHPVTGGGPGTYQQVSSLGHDPDFAAAHSSVLQVGAETGWIGVVLFALLVLGGLLWAARGAPAYAVVGVATWTALVVHSFADHLLEFPLIVLVAGTVLGWTATTRASEQLDVPQGEGPRRR
jgi:O-antigen ligase